MNRICACVVVMGVALAGGCASPAKYVEKKGDTGIVSIPSNTDAWPSYHKRAAIDLIKKHVGTNYEIVEEREVVVGQSTTNNQQVHTEQTVNRTIPFLPAEKQTINNTTTSHDVTEWRIWYRRADGGRPAPFINDVNTGGIAPAGGAVRPPQNPVVPSVLPVAGGLPPGGPVPRYISGGTGSHLMPTPRQRASYGGGD